MVASMQAAKVTHIVWFLYKEKKKPNIFAWDEIPKGFKMNKL